jgi:DNA-binding response OmpR family regulator
LIGAILHRHRQAGFETSATKELLIVERIRFTSKALVVSNLPSTGPLRAVSLQQQFRMNVVLEIVPENTVARWSEEIPDLVILDVNLPEPTLLELIRDLRFETQVPILLFTSKWAEEFWVQAYHAGVDECILKPIGNSLFLAKIQVWLRRSGSIPTEILDPIKAGNILLDPAQRIAILENGRKVRITNLEIRLLYCLMSQAGRTVATEVLIQRVWGSNCEADSTVLKNIVYRLRQKIETKPADPKIIQTVAGAGYRFSLLGA